MKSDAVKPPNTVLTGKIILPDWLITSAQEKPQRKCGVRVVGDRISDVDSNERLREHYPQDEKWEATGQVLAPGFVNTHTHLYGVLAHGIPLEKAPAGFWPFLEDFWWPLVENRIDADLLGAASDLQCARMLKSGVTAFYDCTEAPFALPGCLFSQAEIVRKHGLRAILSFEATERVDKQNGQLGLKENADFIEACRRQGGLVSGMMCFHTTFTCSSDFIQQAFEMAADQNTLVHMHCAEGKYEPEFLMQKYGLRPFEYYTMLGVAGENMLASQCVQINELDIALMAEKGVRMSHMPLSNCEVGGGIAPLPQLIEAGVTVGLGSDSYIDDFFEVMRGAFLIHKANQCNPQVMPAQLVWYLATEGGARLIGLDAVGRLAPGWQADLQLIDSDLPTPLAEHNLFDQLILYRNQSNVRSVMVAGKTLVKEFDLAGADMQELYANVHTAANRLWKLE
ncbi:MAG TPA: amidohydrolase family protein [Anaerolineaceae bacterium]|nr:amidohydrolase family protein [Anaerolineaceae bacterium]